MSFFVLDVKPRNRTTLSLPFRALDEGAAMRRATELLAGFKDATGELYERLSYSDTVRVGPVGGAS